MKDKDQDVLRASWPLSFFDAMENRTNFFIFSIDNRIIPSYTVYIKAIQHKTGG